MGYILNFDQINKKDILLAGGKGSSLGELVSAGIPVPAGFVISSAAFDEFIASTRLKGEIDARMSEVDLDDINSVNKASDILRDSFNDIGIPLALADEIMKNYESLNSEFVAVRSSATAEDSDIASWAGELETYLNTSREDLIKNIKRCWSSLFTPRAIFYRNEKNFIDHNVSVAVVVQSMIQSEVSGICFTVHPVTEDHNQMIIEAGFGLGEAIVGGHITPDAYTINKKEMRITDMQISSQKKKFVRNVDLRESTEPNKWVELGDFGTMQKLDKKKILELAEVCGKVEAHYRFPCDIEWAFARGQFYITQSRPITTLKKWSPAGKSAVPIVRPCGATSRTIHSSPRKRGVFCGRDRNI